MINTKNSAFTLVELIVVIVILAILATIAFLSFSSYSVGARDSVRLSDMTNISKGLVIEYTKGGTYIIPDNYITITASGTNIGYQGYAGSKILNISGISSGKDPLDNVYYTYNTNINQNKYQLMGFLEDGSNVSLSYMENGDYFNGNNIISKIQGRFPYQVREGQFFYSDKVYSDSNDYSKRYPYTKGDQLGILLNSGTQLPVQYNNSNTGFELTSATGTNYVAYINKTTSINSTGSMIGGLAGFYTVTQASSTYPGCDTPDIKLSNGQIWAACNVGASRAFNGINPPVTCTNSTGCLIDPYPSIRNTLGSYFQWGRNTDVTSSTGIAGPVASETNTNFYYNTTGPYDWLTTPNPNLWGGSGTTSTGGTYYTQGQPSSMQGPCVTGYHVPTYFEWYNAIIAINPSLSGSQSNWQNDCGIVNNLKLPLAGFRNHTDAIYYSQGKMGEYRTSSPNTTNAYPIPIFGSQIYILNLNGRAYGFSIRCLKN